MRTFGILWLILACASVSAFGQKPGPQAAITNRLAKAGIRYTSVQTLTNGQCVVDLEKSSITNLAVLKGMPVMYLNISGTAVKDLSPVTNMPLKGLLASSTKVTDLSPLKGMSLQYLDIKDTRVKSLAPLQGMPLQALYISDTAVTDLLPLKNMPLSTLVFTPKNVQSSIKVVRGIASLRRIGAEGDRDPLPAAEFWKKFDKGELK